MSSQVSPFSLHLHLKYICEEIVYSFFAFYYFFLLQMDRNSAEDISSLLSLCAYITGEKENVVAVSFLIDLKVQHTPPIAIFNT